MSKAPKSLVFSFVAKAEHSVKVTLKHRAEVLMLDDENLAKRRQGEDYKAHGGVFLTSPAIIAVPSPGQWHLVIADHDAGEARASLIAA